jgi:hypothetical protein
VCSATGSTKNRPKLLMQCAICCVLASLPILVALAGRSLPLSPSSSSPPLRSHFYGNLEEARRHSLWLERQCLTTWLDARSPPYATSSTCPAVAFLSFFDFTLSTQIEASSPWTILPSQHNRASLISTILTRQLFPPNTVGARMLKED